MDDPPKKQSDQLQMRFDNPRHDWALPEVCRESIPQGPQICGGFRQGGGRCLKLTLGRWGFSTNVAQLLVGCRVQYQDIPCVLLYQSCMAQMGMSSLGTRSALPGFDMKRVANKITKSYLMDPYSMLMHYKRAFKLMKHMKANHAKVLILGNKNQFGIDWKGRFEGMDFDTGVVDEKTISSAPKHYDMILCLDPVLYCRSLHRINVPVMMCATSREIAEHPEILNVTDYLLPSPTRRHDAALREITATAELGNSAKEEGAGSARSLDKPLGIVE